MPTREEWLTNNIPNPYATSTTNTSTAPSFPWITPGGGSSGNYTAGDIPAVSDPESTYANINRDEFLRQKNQYGQFTRDAVSTALTDTNRERYGVDVNPAQAQARVNATNRASALAATGGVNNARINQLDQNRTSIARLMAVSSNSYKDALGGLGTAAANAASRTQAYKSAKANAKSQRINGAGAAVAAGIIFF